MNKNQYRIIFNARRGMRIAVAETAASQGKCASGEGSAASMGGTADCAAFAWSLGGGLVLLSGLLAAPLNAQVIADRNAPGNQRPTILQTANGLPQVNIQTPSAAGVSRNTYSQFDVTSKGVILNNSRTDVNTQLGGYVPGNPWLATGGARVILNEVNSSNASQFRGYVEVAGQRAEVIIANPAGIAVNGGGFLNASAVTLTTGTPVMNGGSLDSFKVRGGTVTIDGAGLDTSTADYTNILARAVQVNAGIWAKDLKVVTGTNNISAASAVAPTVTASTAGSGAIPSYALDVAALGGMYAGKIFLMGTEAGLGVRNGGVIGSTAGDVVLSNNGWLSNSGAIHARGNLTANVQGDITNTSSMVAQGDVSLAAQKSSSGAASQIQSDTGSVIAAGVQADGSLGSQGNLTLNSAGSSSLNGQIASGGDSHVSATALDLRGAKVSAGSATLVASAANLDATGASFMVQGVADMTANQTLRTDGATVNAAQIQIAAHDLSNVGGQLLQSGNGAMQIALPGSIDNSHGAIGSNGQSLDLSAAAVNNTAGLIHSTGSLQVQTPLLMNSDTQGSGQGIEAAGIQIQTDMLRNDHGSLRSGQQTTIASDGVVDNSNGLVSAASQLNIKDSGLATGLQLGNAQGRLIAGQSLDLQVAHASGDGQILSAGDLKLLLRSDLHNSGTIAANRNAQVSTTAYLENTGQIQTGGALQIVAQNMDNAATAQISSANTQLAIDQTLNNRGLIDGQATRITATTLNNTATGRIYGDNIAIRAVDLNNAPDTVGGAAPTIATRVGRLDLGVDRLFNNEGAVIYSAGGLSVGGALDANGRATGSAISILNNSALVEAQGSMNLSTASLGNTYDSLSYKVVVDHVINGSGGCGADCYTTYNETHYRADRIEGVNGAGQIISGGDMTLQVTGAGLNDRSNILAGGALTVTAQSIVNKGILVPLNIEQRGQSHQRYTWTTCYPCEEHADYHVNPFSNDIPDDQTIATGVRLQYTQAGSSKTFANQSGPAAVQGIGSVGASVVASNVNLHLPTSSIYKTNTSISAHYLVETDPSFANYRNWLSSDYLSSRIQLDPNVTQKRLGDGFYEQRLVREQVASLTGKRFLGDYSNDEQQYQALMDAGVTYAQTYQLHPGIALTSQQVAQLTSDIVWLVQVDVTLPDGTTQKVLEPKVYAVVQAGDLTPGGALLSGNTVNIKAGNEINNSGTVMGRKLVSLDSTTVNNLGTIAAQNINLNATQDINITGGQAQAQESLLATAGRDLNVQSTTRATANDSGVVKTTNQALTRLAGLYVSKASGVLLASAGNDVNLTAAQIASGGSVAVDAGRDVNLRTATHSSSFDATVNADTFNRQSRSTEVGSSIQSKGNTNLSAGGALSARAADMQAGQDLSVKAGQVTIESGIATQSDASGRTTSSSGGLASTSTTSRQSSSQTQAVGSSLGGSNVKIASQSDLTVKASNVVADQDLTLDAKNNVNIVAGVNSQRATSFTQKTESGFLSGGGLGISYGNRDQSTDQRDTSTTAAASTLGSIGGNIRITAGNTYTQTGSDVLTPSGNIDIAAANVNINEARQLGTSQMQTTFEQSGLSVGVSGGVIDTLQATAQGVKGVVNSGSSRNTALNALIAYGKGSDLVEQGNAIANAYSQNGVMGSESNPGAAAASGIKVSIGIGSSSSQNDSMTTTNMSAASTVKAAGNVSIRATGQGQGEGNLTIQGSRVQAGDTTTLSAKNDVNILASADTYNNRSSNSGSADSLGVSFGVGKGSAGLSVDASASRGQGQANSDSTGYNNSQVIAGNSVSIHSGADTNIAGGNVTARQVTADVAGDLNIASLQDSAKSHASQSTTGVSVGVPIGAGSGSFSASQANQDSNTDYNSVSQQSGINAGDGGFQIRVAGNTDLKGAVLSSTGKAVQDAKNTLTTETLSTSDLQNSMNASASSSGISVGTDMLQGKYNLAKALTGNAMNNGNANDNDASTAKSAISAAQVTVGGKTTDTSKEQLTDSNGKAVSTDTASTNRVLAKADLAALQGQAQQQQADNMLLVKAATAFTDEAYRTMYKAGAKMYRVPLGCSDQSCAIPLTEQEAMNLKNSQDGSVHLSNNGIFNDLDGAVKYAQQHGGTMNADGNKDYSDKPENQYIIFAPQANNIISEIIVAAVQKSGMTPFVGLTNAEEQTAKSIQQTTLQGQSIVVDSHSRGTLTTTNAEQYLVNQGGIRDANGNVVLPSVQMNNYGSAQNIQTGNQTLQQLTGNDNANINSVVHKNDFIGTVVGGNAPTPTYTSTNADGTTAEVKSLPDGRSIVGNVNNLLTGTATPHNCYGSASKDCRSEWENMPLSNAPKVTNSDFRPPVAIPQYPKVLKGSTQFQQNNSAPVNLLVQPVVPMSIPEPLSPARNSRIEALQDFKKEE